jgi:hypothetical protein
MFFSPNTGGYAYFLYATSAPHGKNGEIFFTEGSEGNEGSGDCYWPIGVVEPTDASLSPRCEVLQEQKSLEGRRVFLQKAAKVTKG